jgi:hypothetical protein
VISGYQAYRLSTGRPSLQQDSIKVIEKLPNYENIEWAAKYFEESLELRAEYRSYIGWRSLAYSGETINIDPQGRRITPQHEATERNSPVVVFLGGSAMWGIGSDDHNTIPALFAEMSNGAYATTNLGEFNYNAF